MVNTGPNNWSSENVWVDERNHVHLKVTNSTSTGWSCAKLNTNVTFGFGTYRWFVEGAIDKFDRNVVLGLFTYGNVDYINEIDIVIAKWGKSEEEAPNLSYSVYPRELNVKHVSNRTIMTLHGTYTTHQFKWTRDHVSFQSQHGHQSSPTKNVFFSYKTPANFTANMPVLKVPLHMNLWNFKGQPPSDGNEVEVVVHDFKYTEEPTTTEE